MVDLISYNLAERWYEVFTAATGLEGLYKVQYLLPDVVLLDVMMEGMACQHRIMGGFVT